MYRVTDADGRHRRAHARELAETILDSGDTLLTILGDILDFSKIDHNRCSTFSCMLLAAARCMLLCGCWLLMQQRICNVAVLLW